MQHGNSAARSMSGDNFTNAYLLLGTMASAKGGLSDRRTVKRLGPPYASSRGAIRSCKNVRHAPFITVKPPRGSQNCMPSGQETRQNLRHDAAGGADINPDHLSLPRPRDPDPSCRGSTRAVASAFCRDQRCTEVVRNIADQQAADATSLPELPENRATGPAASPAGWFR